MRRRDLLIAAAAVAGVIALPRLRGLRALDFAFEPIRDLPGFRRVAAGSVSSLPVALVGIDPVSPQQESLRRAVRTAPCRAVFTADGSADPGKVPVAVFTDYNCPYCPTLSDLVLDFAAGTAPIVVTWHDLPVLGPRSQAAARAALAGARQDAYLPLHTHLMRSVLRPGHAALAGLADRFGLERAQFLQDYASQAVTRQIEHSHAIAHVFGIVGTPAILVGRTLVVGEIDKRDLESLIALEAAFPSGPCGP